MENLYFLLLLLPIVFLVLVGFEVYLRNPNHYENRVAAVNMLLLSLLFVADYAQSVLPPEYALPVAAYLKYPLVLLSAGTSFVLHLAIVRGKSRSLTYVGIGVAAVAAAYFGFAVSLGPDAFFTGATVESIWKTEHPTALTLFFLLPVGAVSIANTVISVAGYRKATAETDKKRMKILLRAHVSYFVSMLLVIPIIVFGSDAFVVPSIVQLLPTLVWGIAFRILMIHQDIFPSASSKYEALFRISPAAIVLLDSQGRIQEANSVASLLLGGGERQFLKGLSLMRFFPYEDKLLLLSGAAEQELKLVPLSGASKTVLLDTETMTTNGERFRLAVIRDITERKDAEKRTLHQAMHDPLTSLPNRLHFNKRLDEMLAKAESEGMRFAVAMIDMDRFKNINDTLGHQYGDEALMEIASRLSACMPEDALLARLGGDEFSVLLPFGDRSDAGDVVERVIGRFEQPVTLLQQEFTIGASVGVCYYPEHGRTRAQLMKHADIAMYQAKTGGGNHCLTFAQEMNRAIYRNVELEAFLRKALAKGELE
ncbi:MAG TPA: sensor domain-containing diguanylate cyclase, partial [Paenibacillus sp.]|nr:sensor domain-containing diguanylate cyclase [Paenibacillus sp.]